MTHGHELYGREGVSRMEWSDGGAEWDNCDSIINKYIKKKKEQRGVSFHKNIR